MAYTKGDGIFHTFTAVTTGLKQYQFVATASTVSARLINPTTSGVCIGVLVSSGTTGSTGRAGSTDSGSVQTVQLAGVTKVRAGSTTIAPGGYIKGATDGRATATTGPTSTSFIAGMALTNVASTSTSGEIISVLLNSGVGLNA